MLSKTAAFLLFASAAVAVQLKPDQLHTYSFAQYVSDFGLTERFGTVGSTEYSHREGLFAKELTRVIAHNAANKGWKETINQFSVLTPTEMKVCRCSLCLPDHLLLW
jgi:hypothetical protein